MPKTNLFGHNRASAQFGPISRNAENECFWAHSGFRPSWSKPGATHPPTHPPTRAPPNRAPPTHPPTHPPTRAPRTFLGTFRLQPNLVRTAGMPKTNLFGHIRASAQFGPNSRNAKNESFLAHSGFSPIWSEMPECRKGMFLGTFGLLANLVQTGRHPPTHPPTRALPTHPLTHPPGRHECFWARSGFSPIWSEQPECQKRIFLGTLRLRPSLVRTAGMPKANVFGHIRASARFGPNRAPPTHPPSHPGATHPPTHPPGRHPAGRHPPTRPPNRAPGMFLANLVRTAGMPKTNVFGHIRASGQVGPNRAPPTHPPTHPPGRHPTGRHPPTHPPTHPPGRYECFWAHSGFSPIWSEQPECQKRIFLGTFGLQPNLVKIAGPPKTNLFGHIRASAQFGPNSRNVTAKMWPFLFTWTRTR